jgi:protein-S-isoprenylcysteine O-methyltransferase Ste14
MLLAVIILIAAGIYVVAKRKVQASSSFVIQGRPAVHIGVAFILGGVLAVVLPMLFGALGLVKGFVSGLILSITTMFASLVYVIVIIVREKRRQIDETVEPPPENKNKT